MKPTEINNPNFFHRAVDLSDVALGRLDSAAAEENISVKTVVGDIVEYLNGGEQFDLVVLAYIQWMPEERAKLLA